MPSPFPGMDPYLERHWGDVHTRLITYASDQLQKVLPRDLRARVEERIVVTGPRPPRSYYPDVRVVRTKRKGEPRATSGAAVAYARPIVITLPDEFETQTFIEVRDLSTGGELVTVLEVLSPSNKVLGPGREQYRQKQEELADAGVSLVEIDLLRGGKWVVVVPAAALERKNRTPYRVVVRRGWLPTKVDYYPIKLSERLPVIRVPLRPTDEEVPLDLQALLDQCYENGGYDSIDYSEEPTPPLSGASARWAARTLARRRRGARSKRKT